LAHRAVGDSHNQLVVDEIELDREPAGVVIQGPGDQPARTDLQRDTPRVIQWRRRLDGDLADDLRPHVQRLVSLAPFVEGERGPRRVMFR